MNKLTTIECACGETIERMIDIVSSGWVWAGEGTDACYYCPDCWPGLVGDSVHPDNAQAVLDGLPDGNIAEARVRVMGEPNESPGRPADPSSEQLQAAPLFKFWWGYALALETHKREAQAMCDRAEAEVQELKTELAAAKQSFDTMGNGFEAALMAGEAQSARVVAAIERAETAERDGRIHLSALLCILKPNLSDEEMAALDAAGLFQQAVIGAQEMDTERDELRAAISTYLKSDYVVSEDGSFDYCHDPECADAPCRLRQALARSQEAE